MLASLLAILSWILEGKNDRNLLMISMDQYAKKLIDKGAINAKDVEWMLKKDQTN